MRLHHKYPFKWVIAYKTKEPKINEHKKKKTIYIFYLIIFLQDFLNIKKEKEKRITIIKIYLYIYMGLQISTYKQAKFRKNSIRI